MPYTEREDLLGINQDTILEKMANIPEPYGLFRVVDLWEVNHIDKVPHVSWHLAALENKGLLSSKIVTTGDVKTRVWWLSDIGKRELENRKNDVIRLRHEAALGYQKLKDDAEVSRWIRKTYWLTMIAAIIAALVSVLTLFIQLKGKE